MNSKRDNIDLIVSMAELTSVFDRKSNLSTLLQDIAVMVAEHMSADVCSVYLYNKDAEELVLRATVGLSSSSVGRVKMKLGEGITGIALKELRTIREARASLSPGFKSFKNINEEEYEAFLAVPIKKGLNRIGVLTLQHREPDYFSSRDASAMKAIASQLAASIENSQLLIGLREKREKHESNEEFENIRIPGSGGIRATVLGKAYFLNEKRKPNVIAYDVLASDSEIEGCSDPDETEEECILLDLLAFDKALELSMSQLEELQVSVDDSLSDVAGMIFTAHFLMLRDENFTGLMRSLIEKGGKPDEAVRTVTNQYADIFRNSDLSGIREKVQDIKDLEHRLLANLYGDISKTADYSTNIVVADNIFPSELVKLWLQKSKGLVLCGSGITAHISILARSLSFPLLMTEDRKILRVPGDSELLMDTTLGFLYVNPSEEIKASYRNVVEPVSVFGELDIPEMTETTDGVRIKVQANINIIHDVEVAVAVNAEGIGLYRSEFPFIIRNEFPSEEEQYRIYRKIFKKSNGQECILRTLDIGGDKIPGYTEGGHEANPFLGFRGIRFSLGHPEVFQDQIRAMLRAGEGWELKIMFPMISSLDEFLTASALVKGCIRDLEVEGIPANNKPLLGAMVELPAAVEIIRELSAAADFLSIGTNDLIMYTLAVDRTNEKVRNMYKAWHPAVLRSLKKIADQAYSDGTELSVCGEAASDPEFLRFLIGLKIRKFSVDPLKIPLVKSAVINSSFHDCEDFAGKALAVETLNQAEILFASMRG
ncbi:MAG: phosphoenolpyruvate--protein phosphotransferase [Spirochaetales bacterium]|nr:phosphoenolpyruvate--protein phosphotransferase [Spirochaetales bacterium]